MTISPKKLAVLTKHELKYNFFKFVVFKNSYLIGVFFLTIIIIWERLSWYFTN